AIGDQWFGIDDTQAIFEATSHLVQLGHRRIGYVGGTDDLPTGSARLKGYHKALTGAESGEPALVQLGAPGEVDFGANAVRRLLSLPKPPTAVVAGSVQMTQGILEELLARGIRVPDDLSVVGFGDELGFRWWGPGLTTVGLPVHGLATACGLWFVHHVRQDSATASPYTSISPATLILRGSTRKPGPPPKTSVRASPRRATA